MNTQPISELSSTSKNKNKQKKMTVGYGVLLLFIPFLALLFNPFFYDSLYEKHGSYDRLGEERVQEITSDIFSFFLLQHSDIEGFSSQEISHMKDVRVMVVIIMLITTLSYILLVRRLLYDSRYALKKMKTKTKKDMKEKRKERYLLHLESASQSAKYLACFLLFLGACILLFFEQTFTIFHVLLFPQGNWLFDAASVMIQTFPAGFFMDFALWWFGIVLVVCASILFAQQIVNGRLRLAHTTKFK